MTKRVNGLLALATTVLLGLSVAAQQAQDPPQDPAAGGQMSMGDMMKGCRERCDAASKSMSEMAAAMDEAKQSNDPARMRVAMDRMQKPMAEMKEHMDMCMRMMMHGKGGMMSGMMGRQKPSPSPPQSAQAALNIALTTQPDPDDGTPRLS